MNWYAITFRVPTRADLQIYEVDTPELAADMVVAMCKGDAYDIKVSTVEAEELDEQTKARIKERIDRANRAKALIESVQ